MEKVACPYCEVDVKMEAIDSEGGACPECGAMVTGSLLFDNSDDLFDEDEELENDSDF